MIVRLLLALLVLLSACSTPPPTEPAVRAAAPAVSLPSLDDLVSAHIQYGLPAGPEEVPQTLYATHPAHRERLALLLDRLAGSEPTPGGISPPSGDAILHLALKSGQTLSVRHAYHCSNDPNEKTPVQTCTGAPGEIILQMGSDQAVRLRNRAMSEWLSEGWREEFPLGPSPPMVRETALEIAGAVDPTAAWKATFQEEYPVETREGTRVRPAWVVEAESPAGSKTRLVIDAHTGEILLQGHLEALP